MKFPSVAAVAQALRKINDKVARNYDIDTSFTVRLEVFPGYDDLDGDSSPDWWTVDAVGDDDQATTDAWGTATVPGNGKRFASDRVARNLIEQARSRQPGSLTTTTHPPKEQS